MDGKALWLAGAQARKAGAGALGARPKRTKHDATCGSGQSQKRQKRDGGGARARRPLATIDELQPLPALQMQAPPPQRQQRQRHPFAEPESPRLARSLDEWFSDAICGAVVACGAAASGAAESGCVTMCEVCCCERVDSGVTVYQTEVSVVLAFGWLCVQRKVV
jgi:hypothetical protein